MILEKFIETTILQVLNGVQAAGARAGLGAVNPRRG